MNTSEQDGLYKLFQDMQRLRRLTKERNIFSIGARGYYENPTSDILAFFLDPAADHGLYALVLSSLLSCLDNKLPKPAPYPGLERPPMREYITESQKRIDLVLEGGDWVMAIENKIRHEFINDFEDYRCHIDKIYSQPEKRKIFVILSAKRPHPTPQGWIYLGYEKFLSEVRCRLGEYMASQGLSKWTVFLREFLLNIEDYLRLEMNTEDLEFVNQNYASFNRSRELLEEYLQHLRNSVNDLGTDLVGWTIAAKRDDWRGFGIAIRAYPWREKINNVTLLVCPDGRFEVKIYLETRFNKEGVKKSNILGVGYSDNDDERVKGHLVWVFNKSKLTWDEANSELRIAFPLLKELTDS